MSYAEAASVYIGDVSSQVYEFLRRPRPCVFLNLDRVAWRGNENYEHWKLGQIVESLDELEQALRRAREVQPQFEAAQRKAVARSIAPTDGRASQLQAEVILAFAEGPAALDAWIESHAASANEESTPERALFPRLARHRDPQARPKRTGSR